MAIDVLLMLSCTAAGTNDNGDGKRLRTAKNVMAGVISQQLYSMPG